MAGALPPIPYTDSPIEGSTAPLSHAWFLWLYELVQLLQSAGAVIKSVAVTGQAASIASTDLGVLEAGVYRVSWTFRITVAATTSSSLQFSVAYLDNAVSLTQAGTAATGNTTTTVQSGAFLLRSDAASPVTFSTTYASVGGTPMQYKLNVVAEQVV